MKVFIYRNLHFRNQVMFSVRNEKTKLVIDHAPVVYLAKVRFKVSEAGRQRVIREKRKNVHAGAQGMRLESLPDTEGLTRIKVSYNPYKGPTFVTENGTEILSAEFVEIGPGGLFAYIT